MTPPAVHFGFPLGVSSRINANRSRGGSASGGGATSGSGTGATSGATSGGGATSVAEVAPGANHADNPTNRFSFPSSRRPGARSDNNNTRRCASVYIEGPPTSSSSSLSRDGAGNGEECWACLACTFQNNHLMDHCEVCEMPRYLVQNPQWGF